MKRLIFLCTFLMSVLGLSAQDPYMALQGIVEGANGPVLHRPHTILAVDITVQSQQIIAGPYARYAQKFLGVRAPLTDKHTWTILSSHLSLLSSAEVSASSVLPAPQTHVVQHAESDDEFARIQIDKTSSLVPTLEAAAEQAAKTIFSLRHHRMELITGEAGENVFGEGLKAALDEIARLEQAYLELFMGRRVLKTQTRRYVVHPVRSKKQYVVCRFNPATGLLPESDLSGDMVLLQIEPQASVDRSMEAGVKDNNVVECCVANASNCIVMAGGNEYVRQVLPIFEFGEKIMVPVMRKK